MAWSYPQWRGGGGGGGGGVWYLIILKYNNIWFIYVIIYVRGVSDSLQYTIRNSQSYTDIRRWKLITETHNSLFCFRPG